MAFVNSKPVSDGDWGSMGVPLTIQGLVLYGEASGKSRPIELAKEFAAGILCDHDKDQGRHYGEDGGITAHFHSGTASAVGIAALGRYLMTHGERGLGRDMLIQAKKTYDWIFAADNPCRGSRIGWIPEHRRAGFIRLYGEICGTADVIELSAILADSSRLDPAFAGWVTAYDDVASMTVNTLALAQFRSKDPRYLALLETAQSRGNNRLSTRWTELKLNSAGGWEHEVDGGMTYPLKGNGTISQVLWSVGYDGKTAGFIRTNKPAEITGINPIEPLKLSNGQMIYRCRTLDKTIEISGKVYITNGVTARSEITIKNAGDTVLRNVSYAAMVNFDFADWAHTHGSVDAAKGIAVVGDNGSTDVAGLYAPGAAAVASDDFEVVKMMVAAADVRPSVAVGNCNTVSAAGWRWNDLKPGDTVTLSYDMALGRSDAELRTIFMNGTIPADFPTKDGTASEGIPDRYDGAWLACFPPNDLTLPRRDASGGVDDWAFIWGCCMYSGVRGIGAAWESSMVLNDGVLKVNWFAPKHLNAATLTSYLPKEGKVKLALTQSATTMVRIPGWLSGKEITSRVNGKIVHPHRSGAYLNLGRLPAGSAVTLSFPLVSRSTHEYIGGDLRYALNSFSEMFAPLGKRSAYDLVWRGDYVESMDHAGRWPVFR
jgi:hypothetical protein